VSCVKTAEPIETQFAMPSRVGVQAICHVGCTCPREKGGTFGSYLTRGVTTAGDTGDASPVRPTMSPYIKMTTDSLSSELTFDE